MDECDPFPQIEAVPICIYREKEQPTKECFAHWHLTLGIVYHALPSTTHSDCVRKHDLD
jgi:hypothetical protein